MCAKHDGTCFLETSCTLLEQGSKKVPPDGLRLDPEPQASEEPFAEERVCQD